MRNMICNCCKIDKTVTDFINNNKICYQCIYREKLLKNTDKRTLKILSCRICGNEVKQKANEKKRQRTIFCSSECAKKGHKDQLNNHWTRKLRVSVNLFTGE